LEVPTAWEGAVAATAQEGSLPADWWREFGDPRLDAWIDRVLADNFDLATAAARLDQAAARARIAGAALRPQVEATVSGRRNQQNFIGLPIPGSSSNVLSTTSTNLGVSLNASWEADLWGRFRAGEAATLAEVGAARAEFAAARLSLAAQATRAWFAALEAGQQVELAQRTLDNRRRTTERIDRRYRQGLRPPVDLRLARSAEASAEAALSRRQRVLEEALRQLEILRGRYPKTALAEAPGAALPSLSIPVPAGLPSELVTRRPDLAAAERRLAAAGQRVLEARRALYPSLRLTGSTGSTSDRLGDLLDGDFSVWSVAGSLLQPLFQGGRLRAGVDLARATEEEALARYVGSVLVAFGEVESALAAEGHLATLEEALHRATSEAEAARALAEDRYIAGLAEYLEVLESQRQSFTAESQWLEARRQRLTARVDLYLALGGGFATAPALLDAASDPQTTDHDGEGIR
jgi:NodT family efflux transporter outer membrane factor (OMF) lipoprotein